MSEEVTTADIARATRGVRLRAPLSIGGKQYKKGDVVPWTSVYPFFLLHMLMFGGSGFLLAYPGKVSIGFLYAHGGFAILIYTVFYFAIFGRDQVKWMFINGALGVFGIYSEMDWLLSIFGKSMRSFPLYVHVIPFLYYVLYTFLLRHAVLDWTGAREDEAKRAKVERAYIVLSLVFYSALYLL